MCKNFKSSFMSDLYVISVFCYICFSGRKRLLCVGVPQHSISLTMCFCDICFTFLGLVVQSIVSLTKILEAVLCGCAATIHITHYVFL